jgi:hypothetical protein
VVRLSGGLDRFFDGPAALTKMLKMSRQTASRSHTMQPRGAEARLCARRPWRRNRGEGSAIGCRRRLQRDV